MANIAHKRIQQRVLDFSVILSYLNAHCKSSFQISGSMVFVILCFSSRLYNTNTHQYWYLHITQMRLLLILSSKSASSQFLRKTSKEGKLHQQKKVSREIKVLFVDSNTKRFRMKFSNNVLQAFCNLIWILY